MSWVSDYKYKWYEKVALNVLKVSGHIPKHIAFVMDGNRRYARSEHLEKIEGHARGFDKLADCLRWCLDMGIKEVTTFAFSIENYKRSSEEVQDLFNLAREKFNRLLKEAKKLQENGVCIRVIGNISLLPEDLQKQIATAMISTERNDKLFLNIAFSYTSRDEMTQSFEVVLKHGNDLKTENISERLLDDCMYTRHLSSPDLIFRTSGESRLSDFLMWQLSTSILYFAKVLWPQITIWNFFAGIFAYQRARRSMENFQSNERLKSVQVAKTSRFYSEYVQKFLQRLDLCRREVLIKLTSN